MTEAMEDNQIHPTALVGEGVELGVGNTIGPYVVLEGPLVIGDGNWFGPHVCIGTPSQWTGVRGPEMASRPANGVRIGAGSVFREFVTVHQGTDRVTTVGDHVYLMAYAHVPHDAAIADEATLTNAVQMGGHAQVGWRANVGLGSVVHQRKVIGPLAMIGMQSVVTDHVPPATTAFGSPARPRGANRVGLERAGFSPDEIEEVAAAIVEGRVPQVEGLQEAYRWYDRVCADNADDRRITTPDDASVSAVGSTRTRRTAPDA